MARKPGHAVRVPHFLQFMRRPGKQHDDSRLAVELGFQPLSGRRAPRVRQHHRALQHVSLLGIVLRHLQAPLGEALVHRGNDFVISFEFNSQGSGHGFARQIVLRWSQSAHEDGDVGAADRRPRGRGEVFEVVANHGLECDTDPKFVETAGEEEGIGVLPVRSQHLRADGDDFRDHRFQSSTGGVTTETPRHRENQRLLPRRQGGHGICFLDFATGVCVDGQRKSSED